MDFWAKLPTLRPLKGFSRFLYVCTHWDEIDAERKRRDERLQAVEETMAQMMRLQREAHEAEKQKLERWLDEQLEEWEGLASRSHELAEQAVARFDELHNKSQEIIGELLQWLAVMLYLEESPIVRGHAISKMTPRVRAIVSERIEGMRAIDEASGQTPSPSSPE